MKNLNKKIGVVALAGMMVLGGVVASGRSVQAAPLGGIPSIAKKPNVDDYNFVKGLCDKYKIKILISNVDRNRIDSFIKKEFKGHQDIIRRLEDIEKIFDRSDKKDLEDYLKERKNSKKHVHRFKFGHYEYLIQV